MLVDTMIMAQQIGGDGANNLVDQAGDWIKGVGTAIIVVAALIFGLITMTKAMAGFKKKNMGEGVVYLGLSAAIVIIAIIGIGGLFSLVDAINPVQESDGNTELLQ